MNRVIQGLSALLSRAKLKVFLIISNNPWEHNAAQREKKIVGRL